MDELISALKQISENSLENDRAIVALIQALIDKVNILEYRISILEKREVI